MKDDSVITARTSGSGMKCSRRYALTVSKGPDKFYWNITMTFS